MKSAARVLTGALALCTALVGILLVGQGSASAVTANYGYQSVAYSGVANPPTSDKPQSKLWWNAGSWWADMWTSTGWHIFRLDRSTETWVDTGVVNDTRGSTLSDTLWDGTHLYIASHVVTISTDTSPVASQSGQPAKLYRYSYSNGIYTLDSGFPTQITNNSSESMTIDRDSTGAIWATWTQVAGSASAGWTNTVYVNRSAVDGAGWSTPFVIPVGNPNPSPDDISAVVAFGTNKIGVMWSDQSSGSMYFAYHPDGSSATTSWTSVTALQGKGVADDHINLKTLQADTSGRVYAAVKTSLNDSSSDPSLAQLYLLTFNYNTKSFNKAVISTVGDCVSRPQVVLDSSNSKVHVFQTAPSTSVSGCSYSGVAGSIYEKTAAMSDTPSFPTGRGTPVIQDGASANINNVTTTKQSVTSATGLVVMASNDVTKRYWFADESLGAAAVAPVAGFSAAPTSGAAPLPVAFTDTSSNGPTSWSWNFGDGGTSTSQNPSHTYSAAGTYTVSETATNSAGSNTVTRSNLITVSAAAVAPVAGFSAAPTSGAAPLPVAFTDTSSNGPTSWSWNFGDGGTSTSQNPSHTYSAAGTYTVSETATNSAGSNTVTRSNLITVSAAAVAPVAGFSAAPTSGAAPLPVAFTDTSSNGPTSWSWNFGDGGTSTSQNPSHTYSAAGTYTVSETATNSAGSNTVTRSNLITVNASTGGITEVASTTAYSATAATAVGLSKPAGVATGDVLVASVTADLNPTVTTVPSGWTQMVNGLSVNSSSSSGARIFVYYHVVSSSDPATYSWTLSAAEKWGAGVTAYRGVNTSTPLDSSVATAANVTYSATSLTLPSITTASSKALLIGGIGLDSSSPGVIVKPSGWTEEWQAGGGQIAEQADAVQTTAGASGTATWTLTSAKALAGWRTALKPLS